MSNEVCPIKKWLKEIYSGSGGFLEFAKREMGPRGEKAAMEWVIRCLGNPDCKGSQEIIDLIMENSAEKSPPPKVRVATAYGTFVPNFNGGYYKPGGGVRIDDVET